MTLRKLQDGPRGTVVVYHSPEGNDDIIKIACEGWTVYMEKFASGQGLYDNPSDVTDLPRPLVLAGFSEGCDGVRAQLLRRVLPEACIAIDGIQTSFDVRTEGPLWEKEVEPWQRYIDECSGRGFRKRGELPAFMVSATSMVTHKQRSMLQSIPVIVTDIYLYNSVPMQESYIKEQGYMSVPEGGFNITVKRYPGKDGVAHAEQGKAVLPASLWQICNAGGHIDLGKKAPPKPSPATPPAPPVKPVSPPPPVATHKAPSDSSSGAAMFGLALAGLGFIALRKR